MPFTVRLDQPLPDDRHFVLFVASCPLSAKETRNFTWNARNYDLDPSRDQAFVEFQQLILEQDRVVVESQRPEELPIDLSEELHIKGVGPGVDRLPTLAGRDRGVGRGRRGRVVTFDLTVFPVDRPLTFREAAAEIEHASGWRLGLGHDRRLDPFITEMERRFPGIRGPGPEGPPVEFTVTRGTVGFGIGWSVVEELVPVICEVAFRTGLAVWDPQRETIGLPAPFSERRSGPKGSRITSTRRNGCWAP